MAERNLAPDDFQVGSTVMIVGEKSVPEDPQIGDHPLIVLLRKQQGARYAPLYGHALIIKAVERPFIVVVPTCCDTHEPISLDTREVTLREVSLGAMGLTPNDRGFLWEPALMQRSEAYRSSRCAADLAWLNFLRHTRLIDFATFCRKRDTLLNFHASLERTP